MKKVVSLRGAYHINIDVNNGSFFGNYSQDTDECYLVFVSKGECFHSVLISVLANCDGEIEGEMYGGLDHEIVRQILQLGHLSESLREYLNKYYGSDTVAFFDGLCE